MNLKTPWLMSPAEHREHLPLDLSTGTIRVDTSFVAYWGQLCLQANLMKMKKPWLEFDKAKKDLAESKEALQVAKANKQEKDREMEHLKAPLE
jgi:hypothetical protein